jgi:NADH dehydrogenase
MKEQNIVLLGGAGFIGSHIVHRLDAAGYNIKVLARKRESAKHLILLPNVQVLECDIMDDVALRSALTGADAVINLIGILHQGHGATFSSAHAELPERLAEICRVGGVARLLHMSALNADVNGPSAYLRSKGAGEAAVKQSGLAWTIFRPSVVFGTGDSFLTLFSGLAQLLPVMFLACPNVRFQPVWVEDLVRAVVQSLDNVATVGQSYDLCGPKIYTLRELVAYAAQCAGTKPCIVGLNSSLSMLQAAMMELLPVKLMTRDNVLSMKVDSVCGCAFPPVFGIIPTPLEAVAPDYLAGDTPRAGYLRFRTVAGR